MCGICSDCRSWAGSVGAVGTLNLRPYENLQKLSCTFGCTCLHGLFALEKKNSYYTNKYATVVKLGAALHKALLGWWCGGADGSSCGVRAPDVRSDNTVIAKKEMDSDPEAI